MRNVALALLLSLGCPALVAAQTAVPAPPERQTVTVSATGSVTRAPDQAAVTLAVESFAATAREAAEANAAKMQAVVAALRQLGIPRERIETVSYQLNPEYDFRDRREPGQDRVVGYRAINMVRVTVDEIARVGAVIDAALAAGANRVGGLAFQLRDPDAARLEALQQAVARARREAEAVARALGRPLGPALDVRTTGAPPPVVPMARAEFAEAAPTPVEPGTLDVTAGVTIVFALGEP